MARLLRARGAKEHRPYGLIISARQPNNKSSDLFRTVLGTRVCIATMTAKRRGEA